MSPTVSSTHGLLTTALIALSRNTFLGRGQLRKVMAGAIRSLNSRQAFTVPLYGGWAHLHHTGNNCEIKALLNPKRFAREEYAFCRQHMPAHGGVFFDIGGNAGIFSLRIATMMQSGTVIAVEPQTAMFDRLQHNFALNPQLAQRLDLHFRAIAVGGSTPGKLTISVPEESGCASMHPIDGAIGHTVTVLPMLDVLCQSGAQKLDVLKIDVEGYEDQVLFPFFETAPAHLYPQAIIIEVCHKHLWRQDCHALLVDHGYRAVRTERTNMMLARDGLS